MKALLEQYKGCILVSHIVQTLNVAVLRVKTNFFLKSIYTYTELHAYVDSGIDALCDEVVTQNIFEKRDLID